MRYATSERLKAYTHRAIRSPEPPLFPKEIYFAVSKIAPRPGFARRFQVNLPKCSASAERASLESVRRIVPTRSFPKTPIVLQYL
jgi:hypothetical protein